jgi:hypothetical protein
MMNANGMAPWHMYLVVQDVIAYKEFHTDAKEGNHIFSDITNVLLKEDASFE